jgi:uncharacterized membrane protein YhaH (DUF805 family)
MSLTTAPRMSFGTAISTGFRRYADFAGRSGVAEFWWFILFVVLVNAGARMLDSVLPGSILPESLPSIGSFGIIYGSSDGPFSTLWALGTIVPVLAIAVRRLRDGGNGWVQLFWLLLPIVGLIVIIMRMCDPSQAAPAQAAPLRDAPLRDAPSAN